MKTDWQTQSRLLYVNALFENLPLLRSGIACTFLALLFGPPLVPRKIRRKRADVRRAPETAP
jgi:hypothetical protein